MNKEKYLPFTLTNEGNVSVKGDYKEVAKSLCTCHHKCHDTKDCVVEDEALLLINENKSNNFDVKSNNEIEEMADELYYNTPILEEETCNIVAEYLFNAGYRKQSEVDWHREAELNAQRIIELEAELANAKSEVDGLQKELTDMLVSKQTILHIPMEYVVRVRTEHPIYKAIKAEVAREIFEEIENFITNEYLTAKDSRDIEGYVKSSVHYGIAELKKKYTESEGNNG